MVDNLEPVHIVISKKAFKLAILSDIYPAIFFHGRMNKVDTPNIMACVYQPFG
jgi:hypothetical protein